MLIQFYSFYFKCLSFLKLPPKAIMVLALISSLSCPAIGMEDDLDIKEGLSRSQQTGFAPIIEIPKDENEQVERSQSLLDGVALPLINNSADSDKQPGKSILTLPRRALHSPYFEKLPDDLYKKIFPFIREFSDFVHFSATCGYFHSLLNEIIQNKVFIIGPARDGKSTLVHLMLGKPLITKKGCLFASEKIPNVNIDNGILTVGTSKPTCVVDFSNKRLIIDCPPLDDLRGPDQDFINANKLYRLLKGKVSVVLVMREIGFESRVFILLINKLTEIFPNQDQLQNVLSLVVSKQGQCRPYKLASHIPNLEIEKFINSHSKHLTERGSNLLQFLAANTKHLAGFQYADQEGPYPMPENVKLCMQNLGYVVNPQVSEPLKESIICPQRRWSSKNSHTF